MKKCLKVLLIILIVVIALWLIIFGIDYYRCSHLMEPIFVSKIQYGIAYTDGSESYSFNGLGYRGGYSMNPNLKQEEQVTHMEMFIFGAKVVDLKREMTDNMANTKRAVVVKVNEKSLDVMGIENENGTENDLISVSFGQEGDIGFKQGQEILIYFDGIIEESFPAQINNVGKIEIVKEKSDNEIPEEVLRFYYNSEDNVTVSIDEFTKENLLLTIEDTNENAYNYEDIKYDIYKKEKNPDYTGVGQKIGEDTENSTSGYTGTGVEYEWIKLEKNLDENTGDNMIDSVYDTSSIEKKEDSTIVKLRY